MTQSAKNVLRTLEITFSTYIFLADINWQKTKEGGIKDEPYSNYVSKLGRLMVIS